MSDANVDFDAATLARAVENLSQYEIDQLPFGVVLLDRKGTIRFYSETEQRQSGYGPGSPLGQNFYEASRCMGGDEFRGRVMRAMETGPVDIEIGWRGDFADPDRSLRIRVQSASDGGIWLFIERDAESAGAAKRQAMH